MYEVMIEQHFAAAHHLLNYHGQCENQHGHNFIVQAWVQGETLDQANLLIDPHFFRAELDNILDELDHTDLNEFHHFQNESTSSEFIARYLYKRLKKVIPSIARICVYETPTACATYFE